MHIDKTTLYDLSIFDHNEEQSLMHHLNFCKTSNGVIWLEYYLKTTLSSIAEIEERQQVLQQIIAVHNQWPEIITNGSVLMIEKFYESHIDNIPKSTDIISSNIYKVVYAPDYSLLRYSVSHFIDFIQGMHGIYQLLYKPNNPAALHVLMERTRMLLAKPIVQEIIQYKKEKKLSLPAVLKFGHFIRFHYKQDAQELIEIYSRLDALYSLATACIKYQFTFPQFTQDIVPHFEAIQLYHPLLPTPVAYNIALTPQKNFLFLTGANMAGKSTFIKAVGISVYLSHIGMGVPARHLQLNFFDGLISNIHVIDNIIKGESYFFNEVQRIRKTIEQITDGKNWLVLIDELFKGTNVQDAMKCSSTVIEGLLKIRSALFILSTHLYEIGDGLKQFPNILFRYFETEVKDEQLYFNYTLKEGISNDRLGYLILKKEGVVDLLREL
ncbi:MutS-related protein [Parafilimonas terrae]|uniref:MutS domain V n=1 Tax=Parafilimonas terrae TaxID=1465490 RepID=A0A1I5Y072_9BACT|nr:DNA mismatch repair protein MutS [Parafilimonas terrae]SFQ37510.1 MutS domain V [Parafilimonas terrae]